MDITFDIDNINKGLDNIDIKYDKIKEEVSKTSSR